MDVVLRILKGPLVLGHHRALVGEIVRVSMAVAQQVLAERPDWVEVLEDNTPDLFLGPPIPDTAEAREIFDNAPDASAVLEADPASATVAPTKRSRTVTRGDA
jgi:hypothetical protein